MSLLHNLFWSLARRAAADPRMQKKAGRALRAVDRGMDKGADEFAGIVTARDPAREAGRRLGRFFSGSEPPKSGR